MGFNILYAAAPVLTAALGALLTEYAGFLLIGIEGFIVMGSFGCFALTVWTGSTAAGTLISAFLCAAGGFLLARFVRKSGADPFVAGIATNLAAHGLCGALSLRFFGTAGVLRNAAFSAQAPLRIAPLEGLPVLGALLSSQPPFVYAAFACLAAEALFLKSTVWGLRLKAVGLSGPAALERGLNGWRYREASWTAAAFLAALSGCALSLRVGVYAPGGAGSRAWIALAAVYMGFRNIWGILAASLVFAFAENLSFSVQGLFQDSSVAFLGIPSALALLLYVFAHRSRLRLNNRIIKTTTTKPSNSG
ncbi:MAG: ABC transporter permease [Spirochaetaceae bacterium]|jgi:simple sugar transport system permease protein|nr:ABC transporter permease [Spirochaetaceae bacterium]